MAIQWQAIHEYVPSFTPPSATTACPHGSSWPPPVVHPAYEEGEQRCGYYHPPGQVRNVFLLLV